MNTQPPVPAPAALPAALPAASPAASPAACAFPVARFNTHLDKVIEVLGTGFFVGNEGLFVSAKTIFQETEFKQSEIPIALFPEGNRLRKQRLARLEYAARGNLAKGVVENYAPPAWVILPAAEIPPVAAGQELIVAGFSTPPAGKGKVEQLLLDAQPFLFPARVLRRYQTNLGGPFPVRCFEFTPPPLNGAVGAPVFGANNQLAGVVAGSIEYQLLPERKLLAGGEDNPLRTARYLHLLGLAHEAEPVREFLSPPEEKKPQLRQMWQKIKSQFRQERESQEA